MDAAQKHPTVTDWREADWALCSDGYEGEGAIKAKGEVYLPKPPGFSTAGGFADNGRRAYQNYKARAQFPDIMAVSVGAMVGIVHANEIVIDGLPQALEYLHENADGRGLTLVDLHKRITRRLLVEGRFGVLVDAPESGGDPYFASYYGPQIINWDEGFYVLDETHQARDGFKWQRVEQYRVLSLEDETYVARIYGETGEPVTVTPTGQGSRALDFIPFVCGSAKDIGPSIDTPPLVGIARAAKAMYQLSADYRHQLYMSGQETLVAINADAPGAVGAGVVVSIKGSPDLAPDMKYVGPSCIGIDAHREAIEHNRDAAVQSGARLFEQSRQDNESGSARAMRFRSETANLQSIAAVSCAILEQSLQFAARMKGINGEGIIVPAPKDLLDAALTPAEAAQLWSIVRDRGLSYQTFYELVQRGGLASPERTADEEYALIDGADLGEGDAFTP